MISPQEYQERRDTLIDKYTDYMLCDEYHVHDGTGELEGSTPFPHDFDEDKLKAAIDALVLDLIGEDDKKKPNSGDYTDWTVCDTCDVILSDETEPEGACICDRRNELRASLRQVVTNKRGGGND
jgi:hypothetical protein